MCHGATSEVLGRSHDGSAGSVIIMFKMNSWTVRELLTIIIIKLF